MSRCVVASVVSGANLLHGYWSIQTCWHNIDMDLKQLVADSKRPIVFTGAGFSVSSGLPTYRGANGMWTVNPDVEAHSTPPPAKLSDPGRRRLWWDDIWGFWGPIRGGIASAAVSDAHAGLAAWQSRVPELTIVTQNVDGLHQRAGASGVIELHGSIWRARCAKERCKQPAWYDHAVRLISPDCPTCGRPGRPDVVLFGEVLPENVWGAAKKAAVACDLMVVVGTSGAVWPANTLPVLAQWAGARLVYVDPGLWEGPDIQWDLVITSDADTVFSDLGYGLGCNDEDTAAPNNEDTVT